MSTTGDSEARGASGVRNAYRAAARLLVLLGAVLLFGSATRLHGAPEEGLDSDDPDQRVRAVLALERVRGEDAKRDATSKLLKLLVDDSSPDVRYFAAAVLGTLGQDPDTVVPALAKASLDDAESESGEVYQGAALGLASYGERAVAPLAKLLESTDQARRLEGALGADPLGKLAAPLVPRLIPLVESSTPRLRYASINALRAVGPPAKEAVPTLVQALSHEDFHTQYWSCRALGAIGPDSLPAKAKLLDRLEHGVAAVRHNAAAALGGIGPTVGDDAIDALERALGEPIAKIQEQAATALGKLGPASLRCLPRLEQALDSPRFSPRAAVAEAMWRLDPTSPRPAKVLIEELNRANRAPWEAAEVLGRVAPAMKIVDQVAETLEAEDPIVRVYAASALGAMGKEAERFRPLLQQLSQSDPDEEVRESALVAVQQILTPRPSLGTEERP